MSFLNRTHKERTAQINLVPLVDCFIVLLCYLLLTVSFLSLSFVSTTVAGPSGELAPTQTEYLTVTIQDEGRLLIQTPDATAGANKLNAQASKLLPEKQRGLVDFEAFDRYLEKVPKNYREIVLVPTPFTSYQTLVRLTESVQKRSLSVVLSGESIKGI